MSAVPGKAAFVQDEAVYLEGVGREGRVPAQECVHRLGIAPVPPSERDVRHEGAVLGFETDLLHGPLDLRRERNHGFSWLGSGPQRSAVALLELPDAAYPQLKARRTYAVEGNGYVVRDRPFDLADETKREVQLFITHPTQRRTVVHCVDQEVADLFRRSDSDKKAMHCKELW